MQGRGLAPARADQPLDLLEQAVELDGLGVVVVAARHQGLFAVARHGVRGERDDRDSGGLGRRLDAARRLPAAS